MTLNREGPPVEHLGLLYRVSRALLKEGEYSELLSGLLDTLIEGETGTGKELIGLSIVIARA